MLSIVLLLLSVLGTVGIYLGAPSLSLWWLAPVWIGCYVGVSLGHFLFLGIAALFLPANKPIKKPNRFCRFMIPFTLTWMIKLARIRVTVTGKEKLPSVPCVMICNHVSNFDPLTMLVALRERNLVYISKDANFRLPLVGNYINNAGFISIDRNNGMRALRSLQLAAERMIEIGVDVGVYPEGMRSKSGKLLRFKSGAFHLAQMAKAPIVIMTTKGPEQVKRNFPLRRTHVTIEIHEVIDASEVTSKTVDELCTYAREIVARELEEA